MNGGQNRVLVFGVFDGCDIGHRYFLREAEVFGDELVVVVARDEMVEKLKGKCTMHSLEERMGTIKALNNSYTVVSGDIEQYTWSALKEYQPDIVAVGHDQHDLAEALKETGFGFEIKYIEQWDESKG